MAYSTGTHGRVQIRRGSNQKDSDATIDQGHVRNWQITTSISQLDATTLGDTDRVPVNGIRTTRGSCQILYYKVNGKRSSIQTLAEKFVKNRSDQSFDAKDPGVANEAPSVWLKLFLNTDGNINKGYTLQVNITSFQMGVAVGDIVSANIQFESVGAPISFDI